MIDVKWRTREARLNSSVGVAAWTYIYIGSSTHHCTTLALHHHQQS